MRSRILLTLALVAISAAVISPCRAEAPAKAGALPAPDPDDGGITLPPGFRALVVADNLVVGRKDGKTDEKLRFLAVAPNGDIYAKLYHGNILALRDTDGDGRADVIKEFGPGDGGTHIMFHDGWLYHSSRTAVYRYKYTPGELVPSGPMETIVRNLPAEKDHDAKAFAFDDQGRMIVEVGSPYNVFSTGDRRFGAKGKTPAEVEEFQKTYGGFWRFDANKPNQTQAADGIRWSTGHRHSLALAWHPTSREFFMVMMGRDQMNTIAPEYYDALDNAERDAEEMHLLKEGANLGWPYTYWDPIKQARMVGPEYGGDNRKRDDNPLFDKPVVAFPAHWAPLQMVLYTGTQFPEHYRNGMFVAFHGSWNRAPRAQAGYKVAFVPFDSKGMPTGTYETFADGFPASTISPTPATPASARAASPSAPTVRSMSARPRRDASGASSTPGKAAWRPPRPDTSCPSRPRPRRSSAPIRPAGRSTSRSARPATCPTAAASRPCSLPSRAARSSRATPTASSTSS